ncbi:hypothetical protein C7N43_29310 [Sphingobacteriales bacterium UPWRP_1]|nr:hypothetical protein BVG80_18390 [Sphingobacteriales bacterium TSM_CSM]PSJ73401.1 hypothetical protein C7N43_29310 [Sphingobacteriales bacterium UPWRP_1]
MGNCFGVYKKINRLLAAGSRLVICVALFYACNNQPPNQIAQPANMPQLPANPDTTWLQTLHDTLQTLQTPMEQVNFLRTFAFHVTDLGYGEVNTQQLYPNRQLTLNQYYYLFQNDLAGVYCGGAAQFLHLLYKRFGFESCLYNMGGNNGNSHMQTLVKVNDKWYVRDSFYHLTYLYAPDSAELDFCTMLKLLKQGKHDSILVHQNTALPNTDILYRSEEVRVALEKEFSYCKMMEECNIHPQIYDNPRSFAKVKVVFPRTFFLLTYFEGNKYADFLKQNQLPPYYVYLFLFPDNSTNHHIQCN